MKQILIIGGVAAGATAAARARRLDAQATITLLEAGEDVSFANCGLPYYIGGEVANRSDLILASPETFRDQYSVTVHTSTEAVGIDREKRIVTAVNRTNGKKTEFTYDSLILAQGGKPIVPNIPGASGKTIFQLWTLSDMDAIENFIKTNKPRTAAVIGGGFIGLEMTEALARRGLAVNIIELARHIMPNLEPEIAGLLTKELLDHGIGIHTGKALSAIEKNQVRLNDQTTLDADLVLLSVGVRPTLQLAKESGLAIGDAGGLLVNDRLQTSDPHIWAAGDMVEVEHRIHGRKVRIPLAGPANRQGRIAAENALGGNKAYTGASGSSIVKLFDSVAGSTGLSVTQARDAGYEADAVVVHKASHTTYYPGSQKVSLMLVFDRRDGRVLGAQAAGRVGVDKRLDVLATAIAGKLTLEDLAELDLAYAPPFNSPNDPVHMAAFTAENHRTGFSSSVLARNLETFVETYSPVIFDIRDPISFGRAHLEGSTNVSQNMLRENMDKLARDRTILVISDDGQKGHVALRMITGTGHPSVFNLSGGYISLERHARTLPFARLTVGLEPLTQKKAVSDTGASGTEIKNSAKADTTLKSPKGPLVIDVRTPKEFRTGAVPGAINVPLDDLPSKADIIIGDKKREVLVYCASGARSAYASKQLHQMGYTNVTNGGGLHDMMSRR